LVVKPFRTFSLEFFSKETDSRSRQTATKKADRASNTSGSAKY
jgi:hypothetical protein